MSTDLVKYETDNGQVELSGEIIKKYLVPAGKDGKPSLVTDQEVTMFLKLCQYQKLNPFLREVYLIKYGNQPATMVTGKETFLKRAMKNPKYKGHETFITDDGKVATAKVYVEGYMVPITVSVDFDEYVGQKDEYVYDPTQGKSVSTGKKVPNGMWSTKPKTMLKKVALVQALREAFPDSFGGLYSQEEISHVDSETLSTTPVDTKSVAEVQQSAREVEGENVSASSTFVPYAKGGENVRKKEEKVVFSESNESKTVMLGTPGHEPEIPKSAAAAIDELKAKSAKIRDDYSTKIVNMKTRAEVTLLLKELSAEAPNLTNQDKEILNKAFTSKRQEILDALPKTATEAPVLKVGDKVKVRAKPNGAVLLEGEIELLKQVDGKPAAMIKGVPMPVFIANCSKE